ncbi:hypothetical protein Zm00014a_006734 [Zea mays]|uniref:Uncharacterized protein n=2 Tax=Zea mays TaxID=4577 RepID=A0A317Y9I0_MAIZE|nr:hypothetical protein Zm00014a_006734 [Zea mays]
MGASAPTTALSSAPPLPLSLLGGDNKEEEEGFRRVPGTHQECTSYSPRREYFLQPVCVILHFLQPVCELGIPPENITANQLLFGTLRETMATRQLLRLVMAQLIWRLGNLAEQTCSSVTAINVLTTEK